MQFSTSSFPRRNDSNTFFSIPGSSILTIVLTLNVSDFMSHSGVCKAYAKIMNEYLPNLGVVRLEIPHTYEFNFFSPVRFRLGFQNVDWIEWLNEPAFLHFVCSSQTGYKFNIYHVAKTIPLSFVYFILSLEQIPQVSQFSNKSPFSRAFVMAEANLSSWCKWILEFGIRRTADKHIQ